MLQVPPERPMTQQPVRLDVIIGEFTPRLDQPRAVSIGYHLEGTQPRSANRSRLEGTRPKSSPRASRPEGTQPKSEPASAPRGPHKRKQRDTGTGSTRKRPRRGQRSPRQEPEAPGSSRRMCLGILVGDGGPSPRREPEPEAQSISLRRRSPRRDDRRNRTPSPRPRAGRRARGRGARKGGSHGSSPRMTGTVFFATAERRIVMILRHCQRRGLRRHGPGWATAEELSANLWNHFSSNIVAEDVLKLVISAATSLPPPRPQRLPPRPPPPVRLGASVADAVDRVSAKRQVARAAMHAALQCTAKTD